MNRITIVGMRHNLNNWEGCMSHRNLFESKVKLKKEPNNKFDKNAIAVYIDKQKIGYVSKDTQKNAKINKKYEITSLGYYDMTGKEI